MNSKCGTQLLAAVLIAFSAFGLTGCNRDGQADKTSTPKSESQRRVPVVLTPVSTRHFEEQVVVQGRVKAKYLAMVSARIPGTLENIFVDEGDTVVAGKTKLFEVDSANLEQSLEISRHAVAVAQAAERERRANLERVEADFHKADIDYNRFKRLREKDAVTQDAFETQESRYQQTAAVLKDARALVDLAVEQTKQAESALAIAQKNLKDTVIYAPISGRVSLRMAEPGEMADVGKPILRIENLDTLEISGYLPAQYYARVVPGSTPIDISVYNVPIKGSMISYKSPTVNPVMPTFEVKTVVHNPPAGVVPNAMAQITVPLGRHESLGVPSAAVQIRDNTPVVFTVDNGTARMVKVETGIDTDGWTEISGGPLAEGTPVVSMGQFLLNDGTQVTVQEGTT